MPRRGGGVETVESMLYGHPDCIPFPSSIALSPNAINNEKSATSSCVPRLERKSVSVVPSKIPKKPKKPVTSKVMEQINTPPKNTQSKTSPKVHNSSHQPPKSPRMKPRANSENSRVNDYNHNVPNGDCDKNNAPNTSKSSSCNKKAWTDVYGKNQATSPTLREEKTLKGNRNWKSWNKPKQAWMRVKSETTAKQPMNPSKHRSTPNSGKPMSLAEQQRSSNRLSCSKQSINSVPTRRPVSARSKVNRSSSLGRHSSRHSLNRLGDTDAYYSDSEQVYYNEFDDSQSDITTSDFSCSDQNQRNDNYAYSDYSDGNLDLEDDGYRPETNGSLGNKSGKKAPVIMDYYLFGTPITARKIDFDGPNFTQGKTTINGNMNRPSLRLDITSANRKTPSGYPCGHRDEEGEYNVSQILSPLAKLTMSMDAALTPDESSASSLSPTTSSSARHSSVSSSLMLNDQDNSVVPLSPTQSIDRDRTTNHGRTAYRDRNTHRHLSESNADDFDDEEYSKWISKNFSKVTQKSPSWRNSNMSLCSSDLTSPKSTPDPTLSPEEFWRLYPPKSYRFDAKGKIKEKAHSYIPVLTRRNSFSSSTDVHQDEYY